MTISQFFRGELPRYRVGAQQYSMATVTGIYIAPSGGEPLRSQVRVEVCAGVGIVGDRYFSKTGSFSHKQTGLPDREITLIESEVIEAFNRAHNCQFVAGDFRRNLVTRGVALNDLVGKTFVVGNVQLKGIRLCEPCAYLGELLVKEVVASLVHRGGLRAQILNDGQIEVGDQVHAVVLD